LAFGVEFSAGKMKLMAFEEFEGFVIKNVWEKLGKNS
jgi:hypothetical protein